MKEGDNNGFVGDPGKGKTQDVVEETAEEAADDQIPPEVYKVIGAPGTGKTTRVVGNPEIDETSLVMQNLQNYTLQEQMIVTYTNAGVDEAADRLEEILDTSRNQIDKRVTTIHGECYSILNDHPKFNGLRREQVINWWDKKQFCDTYDMAYQGNTDEDDIMGGDKKEGNSFFDIYGWLKSNRKSISDYEDCPQPWTGENDFRFLAKRWEAYKEDNNKIDFSDMIEKVVELAAEQLKNLGWGVLFPDDDTTAEEMFIEARKDTNRNPEAIRGKGAFIDTKVLYVDEVQDLTPLQWAWYLAQKLVCEKVYIGGDDDQTIYGWAGANPDFMLGEEGDFEVLDKTYRIPKEVWEVCDGVIQQVDNRQEKDVEPHGDGGEVVLHSRPSPRQIAEHIKNTDGDVFMLFRARYMIDNYTDELHRLGIPYDNLSTFDTWSDDIVSLRDGLEKARRYSEDGEESTRLSGDEIQAMIDAADDSIIASDGGFDATERALGNFTGVEAHRLDDIFDMGRSYGDGDFNYKVFMSNVDEDEVNYYQKQAVLGNINRGLTDMYPEKVRVGTIHSSKGKEASTVILALDSTQTIVGNMEEATRGQPDKAISDAERRVYYVGMTRSSNKLVLAESMTDSDSTLKVADLLDPTDMDSDNMGDENVKAQQTKINSKKRKW